MDELIRKIYKDIREGGWLQPGEHVVAGVSGGADSVCLLYVLKALQPVMQLKLTAVHIHHGLRGMEADQDQIFVEELCAREGVPCRSYRADIRRLASERHLSEEEAGRMYRYGCFERVRAEVSADRIAVAHHMDDVSETVLMNLFRGSGLKGLAGIPAVRDRVVRPLIHVSRGEIEAFLERMGAGYRVDATNLENVYTRNRIRLDVLPYVKQYINPAAAVHVAETAELAADICRYMEKQARMAGQGIVHRAGAGDSGGRPVCEIDAAAFQTLDIAVQRELLRQIIGEAAGQMRDIGLVHIEDVRRLFEREVGKRIALPYGLMAVRTYKTVRIEPVSAGTIGSADGREGNVTAVTQVPGRYPVGTDGRCLELTVLLADKNLQIPKKMYTNWFDYDKIKNGVVLRYRQKGDYMTLRGDLKKPLRRIFMDDKIPQAKRDSMILLADGSHILWVPDMGRMSEYYKITDKTKRVLAAELKEIRDERED